MRYAELALALELLALEHPTSAQDRVVEGAAEARPVPLGKPVYTAQLPFEKSLEIGLTRLCPQFIRGEGLTDGGRPMGEWMGTWLESGFEPTAFGPESAIPLSGDYSTTYRHMSSGEIDVTFGEKVGVRFCNLEVAASGDEDELALIRLQLRDNGYIESSADRADFRSEDIAVSISTERGEVRSAVTVDFMASDVQ